MFRMQKSIKLHASFLFLSIVSSNPVGGENISGGRAYFSFVFCLFFVLLYDIPIWLARILLNIFDIYKYISLYIHAQMQLRILNKEMHR